VRCARNEGALGFFKGMLPPIVANAPINALLFAVEHTAFKWLETGRAASWSEDVRHLLAGALSGLLQVSLSCPSELVKIQMQVRGVPSLPPSPCPLLKFAAPCACAWALWCRRRAV
jgi:hypothetical protein